MYTRYEYRVLFTVLALATSGILYRCHLKVWQFFNIIQTFRFWGTSDSCAVCSCITNKFSWSFFTIFRRWLSQPDIRQRCQVRKAQPTTKLVLIDLNSIKHQWKSIATDEKDRHKCDRHSTARKFSASNQWLSRLWKKMRPVNYELWYFLGAGEGLNYHGRWIKPARGNWSRTL